MNWLKRKLRRWLENDSSNMAIEGGLVKSAMIEEYHEGIINFNLSPAIGGRILRVTRDAQIKHSSIGSSRDRETSVYVIPSGEDVGERVTKILNLELLK